MATKPSSPPSNLSQRVLVHAPGERPSTKGIHLIPHSLDHNVELCTCYLTRQHGLEHYRLKRDRPIKRQSRTTRQRKKSMKG